MLDLELECIEFYAVYERGLANGLRLEMLQGLVVDEGSSGDGVSF